MAHVQWDLEFIELNQTEATALMAEDMIYDPGEAGPGGGVYYPEDDYTMDEIRERLEEYRLDLI